jgi:hypothetical protein
MTKRKGTNIDLKTLHLKPGVNSGAPEGSAVYAPLVIPVVLIPNQDTDFHGILVIISVLRNEFNVFLWMSQVRTDFYWILVNISVISYELEVFVDVPSQDRFLLDSC